MKQTKTKSRRTKSKPSYHGPSNITISTASRPITVTTSYTTSVDDLTIQRDAEALFNFLYTCLPSATYHHLRNLMNDAKH
jgi:hypothetical protein